VVIPREKLTSFQRWQLASFDQKPAPAPTETPAPSPTPEPELSPEPVPEDTPPPEPPPPALPTPEELQQMIEEARQTAQAEGHRAGYADGHAEGLAAGQAELASTAAAQAERLNALVSNLQQAIAGLEQGIADQLLETALAIAAEVLRGTVAVHKEALLPVIREAIASLPGHHTHIQVHLHPEDAEVLRPLIAEQLQQTGAHVVDNPDITPGGCRVTAGPGEIDASIETRWRRTLEAMGLEPHSWLTI